MTPQAPPPALIEAHLRAASDEVARGRLDDAVLRYEFVLRAQPFNATAMEGLGAVFALKADAISAQRWYEKALTADPTRVSAQINLADLLVRAGRFDKALIRAKQALSRAPQSAVANLLAAESLRGLGRHEDAVGHYARAVEISPQIASYIDRRIGDWFRQIDWTGYRPLVDWLNGRLLKGRPNSQPVFCLTVCDSARDLGIGTSRFAEIVYPAQPPMATMTPAREGRIRLGYLSGEIWGHVLANAIAGVFEHHDHQSFEIFAFTYGEDRHDDMRRRLEPTFDHMVDLAALDDAAAARKIREHDIDILVTASGYTTSARPGIMAHRPAPVQVSYLGWPGTLGAPYIDYLIADRTVIDESETGAYAENIAWLPGCYHATDDRAPLGSPPTRKDMGLPEGAFVFMGYAQPLKITPETFDRWMSILRQVPASLLWLSQVDEETAGNFRREAATRGVKADRLHFAPHESDRGRYIARYALADLYLDTLPYNAHSITIEALWAGLPVLTLKGGAFQGRVCASLLNAAGMSDLITSTTSEYDALAVALATDPERLATVRQRAGQARRSPLFDTAAYTRRLEAAYRSMYERAAAGLPAESFTVGNG